MRGRGCKERLWEGLGGEAVGGAGRRGCGRGCEERLWEGGAEREAVRVRGFWYGRGSDVMLYCFRVPGRQCHCQSPRSQPSSTSC